MAALEPSPWDVLRISRQLHASAVAVALFAAPHVSAAPHAAPTPPQVVVSEKARTHFTAGVNLLQDPEGARYEEAYQQFQAAYADSPSWKILGNLALCAMKLERDGEAIDAYERYLSEGGHDLATDERSQVETDLNTLRASVATVSFRTNGPHAVVIDERRTNRGEKVVNRYEAGEDGTIHLRVRPGEHHFSFEVAGYPTQTVSLALSAASKVEQTVEFRAAEPEPKATTTTPPPPAYVAPKVSRPVPSGVWVGAGVTGALAIGTAVVGVLALDKGGQYKTANDKGTATTEMKSEVETMNLITDSLLAGTVVAGIVTTVLFVSRPEVTERQAVQFRPAISPSLAALTVSGSF